MHRSLGSARPLARRGALGTLAVSVAVVGLPTAASAAAPTTPFVSEFHYDDAGADTGEFVEVTVPAGGSISGWSVVLYNGNGGASYGTLDLHETTAPADAPAAVAVDAVGLQNGSPDGFALVDAAGAVVEFLSYEGTFTATGGPAAGTTSTDIGASQNGTPEGTTLSRSFAEDGTSEWTTTSPGSRGVPNGSSAEPEPDTDNCALPVTHEIGEVQGDGAETPLAGEQVTVRGTVVGDLPGYGGFHLQDPDGDGDAATSDGIFVYSPDTPVDLGDTVAVTGEASDRYGQTQITSRDDVDVCAEGDAGDLPAAAPLDLPADDATRERLEGMLVAPVDTLTVSEVYDLTSYGELTLSEDGLLVQPTELARPGTDEAEQIAAENVLRRIVLDDGLDSRVSTTTRPYLSEDTPVRVGDELTFTEPLVLGYGYNQWRLQPADGTAEGVFAPQNTRPEAPDAVGGDVQVAAFNVLNYFLTFGEPGRGARSAEQLERQAGKIVPAILALDADVVTLMEIEDTDSTGYTPGNADTALADLVRRLNEAEGGTAWRYVPLPKELYGVDRDVIRNGIIYRSDAVKALGKPAGLVDEEVWDNAREPIAQVFKPLKGGDRFIVVANHFKSKSPGDNPPTTGDNADSGDGQGAWNGDRVRQAESLAAFVAAFSEAKDEPDVLLMGDFNGYTQEDPIEALRQAGYTDLGEEFDAGRYSYVYDDMSGSLDHAMASDDALAKVTGVAHWNINAVESFAYQYYGDPALYGPHPYRSSDHDPLVLGLDLRMPGER